MIERTEQQPGAGLGPACPRRPAGPRRAGAGVGAGLRGAGMSRWPEEIGERSHRRSADARTGEAVENPDRHAAEGRSQPLPSAARSAGRVRPERAVPLTVLDSSNKSSAHRRGPPSFWFVILLDSGPTSCSTVCEGECRRGRARLGGARSRGRADLPDRLPGCSPPARLLLDCFQPLPEPGRRTTSRRGTNQKWTGRAPRQLDERSLDVKGWILPR